MDEYERAQADGVDLILDIDVQGAAKVRRALPEAVMVFLLPPSFSDLERRLRGRASDDPAVIDRRLEKASQEIRCYPDYDFVIVNDDLERCVESLKAVVRAARCRTGRMEQLAQQILSTFETPLRRT
jgi:guanylate kinase